MIRKPFDVWYEDLGGGNANVHCVVYQWTHNIRKKLDTAIDGMIKEMQDNGFHTAYGVGAVHPEFCEYMGGEYIVTFTKDNIDYEVYKWELV